VRSALAAAPASLLLSRYSVYALYWYKGADTGAAIAQGCCLIQRMRMRMRERGVAADVGLLALLIQQYKY
jgi:hypothetical protein